MDDYLLTAIDTNNNISVKVVYSKEIVETARKMHNTSPVVSAALGRTLTMASMISSTFKSDKEKCTLILKGNGPMRGITVTAENNFHVKGYAYNNLVDIPLNKKGKLDVKGALGDGTLTVIKDIGLKEPYNGVINLVSGEIAEDFTYYYTKSEQIPSAIGLGVLVDTDNTIKHAGGFWISVLPSCDNAILEQVEKNISDINSVTNIFDNQNTCEDFLDIIFKGIEYKVIDRCVPRFSCDCSVEKIKSALATLSKDEIQKIIEDDQKMEVRCHFCNSVYNISLEELCKYNSESGGI